MSTGLENLNDIIVPEPVPFWPPAPGWTISGLILLSFLIPWLIQAWRRYQADSYRREALRQADSIHQLDDPQVQLIRLLDLLKRTALTAYPREQVAALSGEAWWTFLSSKSLTGQAESITGEADFSPAFRQQLDDVLYNPAAARETSKQVSEQFLRSVKAWIKQHQRVDDTDV